MEEIAKQFRERFPLLSRISVAETQNPSATEQAPCFLGFLLSVMESPPSTPICFVLPRRGDAARIAGLFFALQRFIKKQDLLGGQNGNVKFNVGDNVRVHPGRFVYRFGGFDENSPDFVSLKTLDGTGKWTIRASELLPRLEKTNLSRPIGRLDSPLQRPQAVPLDLLLGTLTFGNQSLIQNELMLLDSQGGFAEFVDSVSFQTNPPISDVPSLSKLLPFGEISQTESGKLGLKKWDQRNPSGEPLIAVTHSAELLANYCIDVPSRSKLIVVNGLSRLKHRQAYDDIADTQDLILFADSNEEEMIEVLGNAPTPCRFWWCSAAEINVGENSELSHDRINPVAKLRRWAKNQQNLQIEPVPCDYQELETACLQLETLRLQFTNDENDQLKRLTSVAWRILNDASAVIQSVTASDRTRFAAQIGDLRTSIKGNFWLTRESASVLTEVADKIETCFSAESKLGINKGSALYRVVREAQVAKLKCALLARNENSVAALKLWSYQRNLPIEVFSPRTLPAEGSFDHLICVSWPGWQVLKEVADLLTTPRIIVLAYPFEGRWLNQSQRRFRARPNVPTLAPNEKAALVSPGKTLPAWSEEKSSDAAAPAAIQSDSAIWNFEQSLRAARKGGALSPVTPADAVMARYASFVGDSFAFFTPTHKISVATELVSSRVRKGQKLPEREISEVRPGDFLVFPESGDRELVQQLADKLIGPTAPQVRKLARMWKDALQNSGLKPEEFLDQARNLNRPRHMVTIRYWFADTLQIGPRELDDLILIALVTNNKQLDANVQSVRAAIEKLWSAHLSAGMRLREVLLNKLPQVINQVEENGTRLDLAELGSAWVVQVDAVGEKDEPRSRGEINRLLWDRSPANEALFA